MFAGLKQQFQKTGNATSRLLGQEQRPAQKPSRTAKAAPPTERGYRRFLRDTRAELKKVTWPTREQTLKLTGVVIGVSIAVGLAMGGVDLVFKQLIQTLLGAG